MLGLDAVEKGVRQGTGQITTFNQLGFKGNNNKPDGWYLSDDVAMPAIILETKSSLEDISLKKWVDELIKNCNVVLTNYKQVVGILYNGVDIRVFLNNTELEDVSSELQNKEFSPIFSLLTNLCISAHFHRMCGGQTCTFIVYCNCA